MSNYETQMCLARQSVGKQDRAVLAKSNAVAYPVQNNKKMTKIYMICCYVNVNHNGMQ